MSSLLLASSFFPSACLPCLFVLFCFEMQWQFTDVVEELPSFINVQDGDEKAWGWLLCVTLTEELPSTSL